VKESIKELKNSKKFKNLLIIFKLNYEANKVNKFNY